MARTRGCWCANYTPAMGTADSSTSSTEHEGNRTATVSGGVPLPQSPAMSTSLDAKLLALVDCLSTVTWLPQSVAKRAEPRIDDVCPTTSSHRLHQGPPAQGCMWPMVKCDDGFSKSSRGPTSESAKAEMKPSSPRLASRMSEASSSLGCSCRRTCHSRTAMYGPWRA